MDSFPKWLHTDWKATGEAPGHFRAGESRLVHSAEEAKALIAKGFTEAPPAPKAPAAKGEKDGK